MQPILYKSLVAGYVHFHSECCNDPTDGRSRVWTTSTLPWTHFKSLHRSSHLFCNKQNKRLFTPVRNSDVSGCRHIWLLSFLLLCFTAGFWVVARFLVWFLVQAVKSDGGFGYVGIAASFRRTQKCIVSQHICDSGLNRPGSDLPSPFRDESRLAVASTESKWGPVNFSIFQPHHPWSPRVIYVTDLGQDGFFCRYHPIFNFCQCILMIDVHLVYYFLLNSFFHWFFHLCYVHPTGTIITVDDLVLSSLLSM